MTGREERPALDGGWAEAFLLEISHALGEGEGVDRTLAIGH